MQIELQKSSLMDACAKHGLAIVQPWLPSLVNPLSIPTPSEDCSKDGGDPRLNPPIYDITIPEPPPDVIIKELNTLAGILHNLADTTDPKVSNTFTVIKG